MAMISGMSQVATFHSRLLVKLFRPPLVLEDREEHGIADMASPGDAVGAHHALARRPKLGHRRLGPQVALVDAELAPAKAAIERAAQHHVLDPPVEAGSAELGPVIGPANLQHAAALVDAEEARHAGQLIALKQYEGAVARGAAVQRDAAVEPVWPEVIGVTLPDFLIFGAGGLQRALPRFVEKLGAAIITHHGRVERGHPSSRSCATFGARNRLAILLPSSKLSSARNFSLAAYLVRTRPATSRWR